VLPAVYLPRLHLAAVLWYMVFPAVDRYLPANEVSVTSTSG
jgi:hypothetical protein